MIVGVMRIELAIFEAQSLKDKRRVILSLKQRIRNRFNVSLAEVDYLNVAKRCCLAVAVVSPDSRSVHSQLDKIVDFIRRAVGVSLVTYERELY